MNGGIAPEELVHLLEGPRRTIRPRAGMRAPSELQLLRHVTELSGGRLVQSRDEEQLLAAYGEILEEMRVPLRACLRAGSGRASRVAQPGK